ncbi:MAG TPA: cupredoxin domain-containing protein [Thermoleophilaceae bacterium]
MKAFTALLAIATLALAACGSGDDNSSSASSSSSAGGAYGGNSSSKTTASSSGSSTNEVEMYDDYFKPKTISGKAGSTVKIELKNEGNNEHNFKIDGQKADADVEPGKNASVSVVIPKSGSVQFYCEYHKGLGMVGTVKPS